MTDVALDIVRIGLGGNTSAIKLGFVQSGAKAAQNDKWIIRNATTILFALVSPDSAPQTLGAWTKSGNALTLTSATTGAHSGIILFV